MAKHIKHDFNKRKDTLEKKPTDDKVVPMNAIQNNTAKEIVQNTEGVRQFADVTMRVLREQIGMMCDIEEHTEGDTHGNIMYHINKRWTLLKWQWPVLLTVRKDFTFTLNLNPSKEEDLQRFYYTAEWLNTTELMEEIGTLKSYITNETVPSSHRFRKESQNTGGMSDAEMDAFLNDYEPGSVK